MLNIDEAIKAFLFDYSSAIEQDDLETVIPEFKALLREIIAEITPEPITTDALSLESYPGKAHDRGYNSAIISMEAKAKELLG